MVFIQVGLIKYKLREAAMDDISMVNLRPVNIDDESVILEIFISSRPDLEWIGGVDQNMKNRIIYQQFMGEKEYLQMECPYAELYVVLLGHLPIGRVYVNREEHSL